jgi:hypothetical protein
MREEAMNCPLKSESTIDVLLDRAAGKLDRVRSARLEQHMLTCADCAAFLAGQTELWQALDAWEPEPVRMDFSRRLWQRIELDAVAPWYRKVADAFRLGVWKPALPLAAAVVLVATAFVMDHPGTVGVTPSANVVSAGISAIDADQVEKTLDDLQLLRQLDASASEPAGSKTAM